MRIRAAYALVIGLALVATVTATVTAKPTSTRVGDTALSDNADGSGHYEGTIRSSKEKCRKGRRVKVIHLSDPPFTIGETTTDEDGRWQLDGAIPPTSSDRVEIIVERKRGCKGASKTFSVDELFEA